MISFKLFFESTEVSMVPPKDFGLLNSVTRLPMDAPYGFWIDRHGNFMPVNGGPTSHEESARKMLAKAGIDPGDRSVYDMLLFAGWLRLVTGRTTNLYWEGRPGAQPSQGQMKLMNFMKDFYDLKRIEEG